jgi:hypothetical protein
MDHLAVDKTNVPVLWWFVVSFRFFGDFVPVSWVFLLVE